MSVTKKLLFQAIVDECGHLFQAWSETYEDGRWEAHFHAECPMCESIVEDVRAKLFPSAPIVKGD